MTKTPLKSPSLNRRARDRVHAVQHAFGKLTMGPTNAMRTGIKAHGKPVLFIHNPRTGGRSLEAFFNIPRKSHAFPVEKLAEKHWLGHFIVVSVRHPMDRFFSGYYGNCRHPRENALVRRYGWGVKDLSPMEFLNLIRDHPRHIGPQVQWTEFPSVTKPRADLILRLEDVANWKDRMREAGLEIGDRQLPHIGKTKNDKTRDLDSLGITEGEYRKLCVNIEDYYSQDYHVFGYKRENHQV